MGVAAAQVQHPPMHTLWTACNMPTLGPHQSSWTAVQPRPTNMFLDPLGVFSHLHFTAPQLDVSCLSCTPAKMASMPVSFWAITLPRLHCLAPAQFLRVPHHPGCHEKSLDFSPRWAGFQAEKTTFRGSSPCKSVPTWPFMRFRVVSTPSAGPSSRRLASRKPPPRPGR